MKHSTFILSLLTAGLVCAGPLFGTEELVLDLDTCLAESKLGQQEQETLHNIQNQMVTLVEDASKELKEIRDKLKDPEYIDSLSPQAEAELRAQEDQLQNNIDQYQNQFPQIMQQAKYQVYQKIMPAIADAAKEIAKKHHRKSILNKAACVYSDPDLDMTSNVIEAMDKTFESNEISKKDSNAVNKDLSMLDVESPSKAG